MLHPFQPAKIQNSSIHSSHRRVISAWSLPARWEQAQHNYLQPTANQPRSIISYQLRGRSDQLFHPACTISLCSWLDCQYTCKYVQNLTCSLWYSKQSIQKSSVIINWLPWHIKAVTATKSSNHWSRLQWKWILHLEANAIPGSNYCVCRLMLYLEASVQYYGMTRLKMFCVQHSMCPRYIYVLCATWCVFRYISLILWNLRHFHTIILRQLLLHDTNFTLAWKLPDLMSNMTEI